MVGRRWSYLPAEPSSIDVDRNFYDRIAEATDGRALVHSHVVPIRAGYAWPVRAGQVCRIVAVEGAQEGDFNRREFAHPPGHFLVAPPQHVERKHPTTHNSHLPGPPSPPPLVT